MNGRLTGNKISADVISEFKMRPCWIQSCRPKPTTGLLIRRPREDPQGRMPCDSGDRDRSEASASQGSPQKLGDRPGTEPPLRPPEGTTLADTLVLNFWLPELRANSFLSFEVHQFVALCYGGPRKLINGESTDISWHPMGWELGGQRTPGERGGKGCLRL